MAKFILIVLSLMLGSLIFTNCTRANLDTVYDPLKQTQHLKELKYRLSDYEWAVLNTYLQKNPKLSKQGKAQTYSQIMVLAEKAQAQEDRMAQLALFKKQQRLKALYRGPVKAIKASDWPMLKGFYPDQHVKQIDWKLYSLVKGKDKRLKRFTPEGFKTCLNNQASKKAVSNQSLYNLGLVCKTEFLKTWRPPMSQSAYIYIDFVETKSRKPKVVGSTNLPDGSKLLVTLANYVTGYNQQLSTEVKNGRYQTGPFSYENSMLHEGTYLVSVNLLAAPVQPPLVQDVIGAKGEYLYGSLIHRNSVGIGLQRDVGMQLTRNGQAWMVAVPTPPQVEQHADSSDESDSRDSYQSSYEDNSSDDDNNETVSSSTSLRMPSFGRRYKDRRYRNRYNSGRSYSSGTSRSPSSSGSRSSSSGLFGSRSSGSRSSGSGASSSRSSGSGSGSKSSSSRRR